MIFETIRREKPGLLDGAVLVRADNVYEYACKHWSGPGVDVMDFPCIRPPYRVVFVEFGLESQWADEAGVCLELIHKPEEVQHCIDDMGRAVAKQTGKPEARLGFECDPADIMVVSCCCFVQKRGARWYETAYDSKWSDTKGFANLMPECVVNFFIDKMGRALPFKGSNEDLPSHYIIKMGSGKYWDDKPGLFDKMRNHALNFAYVALATVSFMNCKNVVVEDHEPSRQQRRHAQRTGKPPAQSYKTLKIYPIRKVGGQRLGGTHETPALHLVRGHFRDYREGNGLGRWHVHGVWWWENHVRGSLDRGTVDKDYDVIPERKDQEAEK